MLYEVITEVHEEKSEENNVQMCKFYNVQISNHQFFRCFASRIKHDIYWTKKMCLIKVRRLKLKKTVVDYSKG